MPPRKPKIPTKPNKEQDSVVLKRKERFGFTIEKDLILLQSAVQLNPWQLGEAQWKGVCEALQNIYDGNITERTVKSRVDLLVQKFTKEQLKSRTGTEEQSTQRGELLQQIIELKEEAAASINTLLGAEEDLSSDEVQEDRSVSPTTCPADDDDETMTNEDTNNDAMKKKSASMRAERKEADAERKATFDKYKEDLIDLPNTCRAKRRKTKEEDLIMAKQEHDIEMGRKRLDLEYDKHKLGSELELKRLELEQAREERLKQESQRSYEASMAQLNFQKVMCELFGTVVDKFKKIE